MAILNDTNIFSKGMVDDPHPKNQPDGTYREARNMIRNPDGDIQNEGGWDRIDLFTDRAENMLPIGNCQIGPDQVLFWCAGQGMDWEIGIWEKGSGYRTVLTTLASAHPNTPGTDGDTYLTSVPVSAIPFTSKPVDSTARVRFDQDRNVYFTSHEVGFRVLNLDDISNLSPSSIGAETQLLFSFSAPKPEVTAVEEGGALKVGVYQFLVRYKTEDGTATPFGPASNPVPVGTGTRDAGRERYDGGALGTETNKSIVLSLDGLDDNYPFYEIAVATYEGLQSTPRYFILDTLEVASNKEYTLTTEDQYREEVVLDELVQAQAYYSSARCVEQKDRRLVLSNLKSLPQGDFQAVANGIKARYFIKELDARENIVGGSEIPTSPVRKIESLGGGLERVFINPEIDLSTLAENVNNGLALVQASLLRSPTSGVNGNNYIVEAVDDANGYIDVQGNPSTEATVLELPAQNYSVTNTDTLTLTGISNLSGVQAGDWLELDYGSGFDFFKVLSVDNSTNPVTVVIDGTLSNAPTLTADFYFTEGTVVEARSTLTVFPSGGSIYQDPAPTDNFDDYKSGKKSADCRTYRRGEVYSFAFVPVFKNGSVGFAYHIPGGVYTGTDSLGVYTSDADYPSDPELGYPSGKVKHHRMPTLDEEPLVDFSGLSPKLRVLGLTFFDIDIPANLRSGLAGYYIVRQRRDTEQNASVLYQGLVKPTIDVGSKNALPGGHGNVTYQDAYGSGDNYLMDGDFDFTLCVGYFPDLIHNAARVQVFQKLRFETLMDFQYTIGDRDDHAVRLFYNQVGQKVVPFLPALSPGDEVDINEAVSAAPGKLETEIGGKSVEADKFNGGLLLELNSDLPFDRPGTDQYYPDFGDGVDRGIHIDLEDNGTIQRVNTGGSQKVVIGLYNIVQELTRQYGEISSGEYVKAAYINLEQERGPEYTAGRPAGEVTGGVLEENVCDIFGGDTFISRYGLAINDDFDGDVEGPAKILFGALMYFFLESTENYNYRHYVKPQGNIDNSNFEPGTLPYYPAYKMVVEGDDNNLALLEFDTALGHSTGYNKQYGYENTLRTFFPKPITFQEVTDFPLRSIWSQISADNEQVDRYRQFLPNDFSDEPGRYEYIADTFVWSDVLYLHTPRALLRTFFNETTEKASSSGQIFTGSTSIMALPSQRVGEGRYGHGGTTSLLGGVNTPYGRLFPDPRAGKFFLFDGQGLNEISLQGLERTAREIVRDVPDNPHAGNGFTSVYDPENSRWICCIHRDTKFAISYHVKHKSWSSYHDYGFFSGFWDNETCRLTKVGGIREINTANPGDFDTVQSSWVEVVGTFKQAAGRLAVFDTAEIAIDVFDIEDGHEDWDLLPSHLQARTYQQHTGRRPLVSDRQGMGPQDHYAVMVDRRLRTAVPHDRVIDPSAVPLDAPTNLDFGDDFPRRMKEEFLLFRLEEDNTSPKKIVIRYIRLLGRPSFR